MIEGDQLWAITHNYNLLKNPNFNQEHSDKDELTRYCRYIPNFKGFDGSNDDHYWITKTIINDLNLYAEFKTIDLNSHSMTTLESYRKMLTAFNRVKESSSTYVLSKAQLSEIYTAEVHFFP